MTGAAKRWFRLWRLLTLRPCELCGDRRRCWRWHVELFDCPTCGTTVDEFDPRAKRIFHHLFTFNGNSINGNSINASNGNPTITKVWP